MKFVLQTSSGASKSPDANRNVSCAHPVDANVACATSSAARRHITGSGCHGTAATYGTQASAGGVLRRTGGREVRRSVVACGYNALCLYICC